MSDIAQLLHTILARLDSIEKRLDGSANSTDSEVKTDSKSENLALKSYKSVLTEKLAPFVQLLVNYGDSDMTNLASSFKMAWEGLVPIFAITDKIKKPTELNSSLAPLTTPIGASTSLVRKIRPRNRAFDNHQRACEESLSALNFILLDTKPLDYVKEQAGSTEFYTNRIRKEYKMKDGDLSQTHIRFCQLMRELMEALQAFVKQFFLVRGLEFTGKSTDVDTAIAEVLSINDDSAAPTEPVASVSSGTTNGGGGLSALMSELAGRKTAAGDSAASGLRKVTKDDKLQHKSLPTLDPSTALSSSNSIVTTKKPIPSSAIVPKNPVCEFLTNGLKWRVEYQTKENHTGAANNVIEINVLEPKHQVYIYRCENVTFNVKGKAKGIVLDSCKKVNLLFDTVIASCEVVNCKNVKVQTRGTCQSVTIDKTDGFNFYISKESMELTTFVTSKSSEMNVNYPVADGASDDFKEVPIPEQFQHKLLNGDVTSEVSELYQ